MGFGASPREVFVGTGEGAINLFDVDKGRVIRTFVHDRSSFVESLSISSNGKVMLSVCLLSVKLWDTDSGKLLRTFNERGTEYYSPKHVVFSPQGDIVFVADLGCVYAWDLSGGTLRRKLVGRLSHLTSLAMSPNGKYVVAGDIWGHINRWQVGSGNGTIWFDGTNDQNMDLEYK